NALELLAHDRLPNFFVRVDRARAHRLLRRRLRVVAAERYAEQLLDEARARAARGGRFGVRTNLVEREQALRRDRLDDRALADSVAAADLGRVGQRRDAGRARDARVADVRLAEQQALAEVRDRRAVAEKLEVPRAVDGVAVEHRPTDLVVLHDDLL